MLKKSIIPILIVLIAIIGFAINSYVNQKIADEVRLAMDDAFDEIQMLIGGEADLDYEIDDIKVSFLSSNIIFQDFKLQIDDSYDILSIRFNQLELSTDFESLIKYLEKIDDDIYVLTESDFSERQALEILEDLYDLSNKISKNYYHKIDGLRISIPNFFSCKVESFILKSSIENQLDFDDYINQNDEMFYFDDDSEFVDVIYNLLESFPLGEQEVDINGFSFKLKDNDFAYQFGVNSIEIDNTFDYKKNNNSITIDSKALTNFAGNYELELSVNEKMENIEVYGLIDTSGNRLFTSIYKELNFFEKGSKRNTFEFKFDGSYEDLYFFLTDDLYPYL